MCEAALQNYATFINSNDTIPTMLFWSNTNCTRKMGPIQTNGDFPIVDNFPIDEKVNVTIVDTLSFFIPFNISEVTFFGSTPGTTSVFRGPRTITDTTLINWQVGSTTSSMFSVPIIAVEIKMKDNWNLDVRDMCMGQSHTIGGYPLERFLPASEQCDFFMTNQYCIGANLENDEVCGCFVELPSILALSESQGVDLPVLCFGQKCATQRTYKTSSILNKPCNMTLCEQVFNSSTGILGNVDATIFCGGHFYDNKGSLALPQVTPLPDQTATNPPTDTPYFVWIILGVSIVLLVTLSALMFSRNKQPQISKKTSFESS